MLILFTLQIIFFLQGFSSFLISVALSSTASAGFTSSVGLASSAGLTSSTDLTSSSLVSSVFPSELDYESWLL